MKYLALSLLAVLTGHATELEALKRINLDEVTRITYDPATFMLEINTVDTPRADGKIEIVKVSRLNHTDTKRILFQIQDTKFITPMVNDAFGIIFDILLGKRAEFVTGAIGVTGINFVTHVILLEKINNVWVGFIADAIRDFQITKNDTFALISYDGALVVGVNPNILLDQTRKNLDYQLFINANRTFGLNNNARLLRPIGDYTAMIWDTKTQFVIDAEYQMVAGGPVNGPVLPTINENNPGTVTTVVFDGKIVKIQRGIEPARAFPVNNPLIDTFADINI